MGWTKLYGASRLPSQCSVVRKAGCLQWMQTRHSLSPLWLNALQSLVLAARFEQLVFAFIQFVATPLIQCSHGYTLRADFKDVCDVRHTYGYGVQAVGMHQGVPQRIV